MLTPTTTKPLLPIGAQLLGRENDEATLLALGAELEADGSEWTAMGPADRTEHAWGALTSGPCSSASASRSGSSPPRS